MMRINYILIDYENVQPGALSGLDAEHFKVMLFVGASQTKLSFEVAAAMQKLGARAQYVKISGNGSNALDFHIAYYIGQLSAKEPTAYFHIISKDAGFDPLIQHLKDNKVSVLRSTAIEQIPMLKAANPKNLTDRVAVAVANLKQRGSSKPRTVKTLSSTLASLFQKQLSDDEITELLGEFQRLGLVQIEQNKVSYALPDGPA